MIFPIECRFDGLYWRGEPITRGDALRLAASLEDAEDPWFIPEMAEEAAAIRQAVRLYDGVPHHA